MDKDAPGTLEERLRTDAASSREGYQAVVYVRTLTEAADEIASLRARVEVMREALTEAQKWIAGQPDRSTSVHSTSFAMLEAIDAHLIKDSDNAE